MKPRNGVDAGLNRTTATGDPTRVADVNGSLDESIPRMLGGDHLNTRPQMTGTATGKDLTGKNRTRDALGCKPDATGADLEAAQAEKSFAKKGRCGGPRPRMKEHALMGAKTHALVWRGSGDANVAHQEGLWTERKTGCENQPPREMALVWGTRRRRKKKRFA